MAITQTPDQAALQKQQDEALQLVQTMLAESNSKAGAYVAQLQEAGVESARLAEVQKSAVTNAANAAIIIDTQQQNSELWAQNTANAIYEAAGSGVAQVAQMQRFNDLSSELQVLQDKKKEIMNTSHTGLAVIDEVINDFSSRGVDTNIELVTNQVNTTAQLAQMAGQMQEGYARVNSLNKQMVTLDTIDANNQKTQALASQERAKIDLDKIKFNSDNLKSQMAAQDMQMRNVLSSVDVSMKMEDQLARRTQMDLDARRADLQADELVLRKEEMDQRRTEWAAKSELLPLEVKAKKLELEASIDMAPELRRNKMLELQKYEKDLRDNQAFEEEMVKSVMAGQRVMEYTVETPEVIMAKLRNPNTSARYIKYQEIGMNPERVTFGSDAFSAADTLQFLDPYGNLADTPAAKLHTAIQQQVSARMQADPTTAPKNKDQLVDYYNTVAAGYMTEKANKIVAGDATNPYQAPPLPVLAEVSPKVQKSPLYNKVLKMYQLQETNPQKIADLAASGVKAKVITPEEAAQGIVDIFTSAAIYNNEFQGGFSRAGLQKFEQRSYKTPITVKPTLGNIGAAGDSGLLESLIQSKADPLSLIYDVGKKVNKKTSEVRKFGSRGIQADLMNYSDAMLVMTKLLASDVADLPSATPANNKDDTTK